MKQRIFGQLLEHARVLPESELGLPMKTKTATVFKGHPNRAKDYVNDVERWAYHAKVWLNTSNSEQAMNALSNAHAAILKAMDYLRKEATPHA